MYKENKGISLIVLVITIIIMIILAAAIILSLSNTNIIDNAKEAVKSSDEASLKTVANLVYSDYMLEMSKGNDPTNVVPYNGDYNTWAKDRIKAEGVSIDLTDYEFTSDGKYVNKKINVQIIGFDGNIDTTEVNWKNDVNITIKINGENVDLSKCKYIFSAVHFTEDISLWETNPSVKSIDEMVYILNGDKVEGAIAKDEGQPIKRLWILIVDKQGDKKIVQGTGEVTTLDGHTGGVIN